MSDKRMAVLMAALGAGLWLGLTAWTGRREAWDSGLYFSGGIPLLMLASLAAGFAAPVRAWRWPAAAFAAQPLALLCVNGPGSMLPLGLVVFGVLSLPCVAAAYAGAFLGLRYAGRKAD